MSVLAALAFWILVCAAWVTHIVWSVSKLAATDPVMTVGQIVLAVIGAVAIPVGMIHGVMIWFGYGI
jgi:hypothetical protein